MFRRGRVICSDVYDVAETSPLSLLLLALGAFCVNSVKPRRPVRRSGCPGGIEVGGGVAGVDCVDSIAGQCLGVLRGQHVEYGLGRGVGEEDEGRLQALWVRRDRERAERV